MYNSSIVNKYGDSDKVKTDIKVLNDIIDRQGNSLLIDCIAEHAGKCAIQFKLSNYDRQTLMDYLITELKSALEERL